MAVLSHWIASTQQKQKLKLVARQVGKQKNLIKALQYSKSEAKSKIMLQQVLECS